MAEEINQNYEVSSEGAVRHWEFPYARLSDTTPTPTNPAMVLSRTAGQEITGTILTVDAATSMAVIDVTHTMVYSHKVRNARTYAAAVEATWGTIALGDPVYYDRSSTMPAGVYLSTSPLDKDGAANPLFGKAVGANDADVALFPKSAAGATTTAGVAIMQKGA